MKASIVRLITRSGIVSPLVRSKIFSELSRRSLSTQANPSLTSLFKNPIVQQLWNARQEAKKLQDLNKQDSENEDTLQGKPPSASRVEVFYPFSKDELLMETYRNPWGQMRFGRIMEDLDALAGNIAFFHVNDARPVIVTASVDRIRLRKRPHVAQDQHLSGQVTWTGTSSMEIRMEYRSAEGTWLEAYVTFVVLDRETGRPSKIPPILPETNLERKYFEDGAKRAAKKKELRKASKTPHANEEVETRANELLQKASALLTMPSLADPHTILMSQTKMQAAECAQPQVTNLHNRIFGGYLMRRAFELAFSTAYVFGGARPIFLEVDEINFLAPVDVGDLLVYNSRVLYTDTGIVANYLEHMSTHCIIEMQGPDEPTTHPVRDDDLLVRYYEPWSVYIYCLEICTWFSQLVLFSWQPLVHVEVETWVTEPEKARSRLSNQFYFTFAIVRESGTRQVLPATQDEARRMVQRMLADEAQAASDDYEI